MSGNTAWTVVESGAAYKITCVHTQRRGGGVRQRRPTVVSAPALRTVAV
jgi:hypothetical protein